MEIRTYDQVDPNEVLRVNMVALDFPFTPVAVKALKQFDRRHFEQQYGVVNGRVAGQVGLLVTQAETLDGPVTVGAVWAVATLPEFGRQGVARELMEQAEARARNLGCRLITLGTGRTRVAHRLYRSMGYDDFLPIDAAYHYGPFRAALPAPGITVRPAAEADLPALEQTFFANTRGMLGWVHRQEDFLRADINTDLALKEIHGVFRGDEPVGFVLAARAGEFLNVRSAVLPSQVALPDVVAGLSELYPTPYLRVNQLTQPRQIRDLAAAGFDVGPTWSTFMLKPLAGALDWRRLFGLSEERFYLDHRDIT